MDKKKEIFDCAKCDAKCCKYVALEIDKPTCKTDYDNIRWYLRHRDVHVFVDHDGTWCIEFKATCDSLGPDNRCKQYDDRPMVCRDHGHSEDCDYFHDIKSPYKLNFTTCEQFEDWLASKGKSWKGKQS